MMKHLALFTMLTICLCAQAQFYPVQKEKLTLKDAAVKQTAAKYEAFSISELITVREFKTFLAAIKKDSSENYYQAQLPHGMEWPSALLDELLTNAIYENEPMPGISWVTASNYCQWLTHQSRSYTFELPSILHLKRFFQHYGEEQLLQCWTRNAYDESVIYSDVSIDNWHNFAFDPKENDPPALKRKVTYGTSYLHSIPANVKHYNYEYQDSSSRSVGLRIVRHIRKNEETIATMEVDQKSITYHTLKNHLHGVYAEYHANGDLKVLGNFHYGQREGVWSIFSEGGTLLIQRIYNSNKDVQRIIPAIENPYALVFDKYDSHKLNRNEQGIFSYSFIEESTIVYSARSWRELNHENEAELFQKVNFQNVVSQLVNEDVWYSYGEHADFKHKLNEDELKALKQNYSTWDFTRIEVKEDLFFDKSNLQSDVRVICISFYSKKEDTSPSFTVYYPQIRTFVSQNKLSLATNNQVEQLDDVFFFHAYRGKIVYTPSITKKETNDWENELNYLTVEHDLWIGFGR